MLSAWLTPLLVTSIWKLSARPPAVTSSELKLLVTLSVDVLFDGRLGRVAGVVDRRRIDRAIGATLAVFSMTSPVSTV